MLTGFQDHFSLFLLLLVEFCQYSLLYKLVSNR